MYLKFLYTVLQKSQVKIFTGATFGLDYYWVRHSTRVEVTGRCYILGIAPLLEFRRSITIALLLLCVDRYRYRISHQLQFRRLKRIFRPTGETGSFFTEAKPFLTPTQCIVIESHRHNNNDNGFPA